MTLYELTTLEKLNESYYECAKPSSWKEATQRYGMNLLENNLELQEELRSGTYRVSKPHEFDINERGKIRHIRAPVMRDRIVQKILCKYILIPQLSRYLIYDNYASLTDRGTSFARKRLEIFLREFISEYSDDGYVLTADIKGYFDNIDHIILKCMVRNKIHEPKDVMRLIEYATIDSSTDTDKGLNLGAEAPQILAVFYLSPVDNWMKSVKRQKFYGRYEDDMINLSRSKEEQKELLEGLRKQLSMLNLELNEKKTQIIKLSHGFTYMKIKYNIDHGKLIKRPAHEKTVCERKRLKKYRKMYDKGMMSEIHIHNCYISWRNNLKLECNRCKKSLDSLDKLYEELFPEHEVYVKPTRTELINQVFREEYDMDYLRRPTWM